MAALCAAQLMVKLVPFRWWRATLGRLAPGDRSAGAGDGALAGAAARRLAVHVERGAARLPFAAKCLPQAIALCWMLRAAGISYVVKIAARPAAMRNVGAERRNGNLHAWVESGGSTVIGALPGPWLVVLTLRD